MAVQTISRPGQASGNESGLSIVAHGLSKSFGGLKAVDGLELAIRSGEVFGFLGPNGAGKTTTVRMLCALIAPTSGRATVDGFEVGTQNSEIRARVGLLTESPGLYENLSAWQNLMYYARLYRMGQAESERQITRYLQMMSLWDRRDDRVGDFSKGMKQKVALTRALFHQPAVLFLDEPTSGLDPEGAKLVRDSIAELRSEGRTIFLCTHNLDEAERLCDRVAIFRQRIIRLDSPNHLRYGLFGRQIEIAIANPEAGAALLDTVRGLNLQGNWDSAGGRLVVTVSDPDAQTPALVAALVAAGAQIRRVAEVEHSLESVYLQLIHEGATATAQA